MATYRPDGTRIRKRDKKNSGNVGAGNVGVGTSPAAPEPEPTPEPSGPIVSDDRDAEDAGEVK